MTSRERMLVALANAMIVRFHIKEKSDELPPMTIGFSTQALSGPASVISDAYGNQFVIPVTEGTNWGLGQNEGEKKVESSFFFNDAAYSALRKLTGQDFGHDKRARHAWWYRNRHELED